MATLFEKRKFYLSVQARDFQGNLLVQVNMWKIRLTD